MVDFFIRMINICAHILVEQANNLAGIEVIMTMRVWFMLYCGFGGVGIVVRLFFGDQIIYFKNNKL